MPCESLTILAISSVAQIQVRQDLDWKLFVVLHA